MTLAKQQLKVPLLRSAAFVALLWALLFVCSSYLHVSDHLAGVDQHCSACQSQLQLGSGITTTSYIPSLLRLQSELVPDIVSSFLFITHVVFRNRGPPL